MTLTNKLRWCPALLGLLLVALVVSRLPPRRPALGPAGLPPPEAPETEAERGDRLDAEHDILFRSMARARKIRQDLIDGRLTLAEAVAALRAESATRPSHMRMDAGFPCDRPADESWFLSTIGYVRADLEGRPNREAVVARLEEEWHASGACADSLSLNPPSPARAGSRGH